MMVSLGDGWMELNARPLVLPRADDQHAFHEDAPPRDLTVQFGTSRFNASKNRTTHEPPPESAPSASAISRSTSASQPWTTLSVVVVTTPPSMTSARCPSDEMS